MTESGVDDITTGDGHDVVYSGAGDDVITTGGGNDILIGDLGADAMTGGTGNDVYYVDDNGDTIVEIVGQGRDVAYTLLSYTLAAGVSIDVLSAHSNTSQYFLDLTGNELDNELVANLGDNVLTGNDGNDVLDARAGFDTLVGGAGNDLLLGGADQDDMTGGTGDDSYGVDDANDVLHEATGEGNDRVIASISYVLATGLEIETVETSSPSGTAMIDLTGNEFGQRMTGNDGDNRLLGGNGADILTGRDGNDALAGEGGADVMQGGFGDDSYFVDSLDDQIIERSGEGRDALYVDFSYVLPLGELTPDGFIVESLSIEILSAASQSSTAAIDLTGNRVDNEIYGNDGNNVLSGDSGDDLLIGRGGNDTLLGGSNDDILDGGTGADTMTGNSGADIYYVDDAGDVVIEDGGSHTDVVFTSVSHALGASASIEILSALAIGTTNAMNLTGSSIVNVIYGNNGANVIDGRGGSDALVGFAGADTFAFTTALGSNNVDKIEDMTSGTDLISLDDAIFTGLATGTLAATAFRAGTAAADADDRIIYDSATGRIWFDGDGAGGASQVLFATLNVSTTLAASDFVVI